MSLTPEQARHAAAMYTALAEGKECEMQYLVGASWHPWEGETMHLDTYTYRVKPEPVNEWWVNVYLEGMSHLYATPEAARKWEGHQADEVAVHVVRADSIKIAELVTDEQIEMARNEAAAPFSIVWVKGIIKALDKAREGK
jgi:hypothetical protein